MVFASMSVSLDGFVAGANPGPGNPLGDDGEKLHEWLYEMSGWRVSHDLEGGVRGEESDRVENSFASVGAFVMGKTMYDCAEQPWGESPPFRKPVYVLTHEVRETRVAGDTTFVFWNDGAESAVAAAVEDAGDMNVQISGGANAIQQCLNLGAVEEFSLTLVPIILRAGVPMFAGLDPHVGFELIEDFQGAQVSHLRYRVTT